MNQFERLHFGKRHMIQNLTQPTPFRGTIICWLIIKQDVIQTDSLLYIFLMISLMIIAIPASTCWSDCVLENFFVEKK